MKTFSRNRHAFTMIELVFVIVITGIVSVAGSKALVQILQNYTAQKEFAKLEMDSASTIRTISRYLQNSIWDSISRLQGGYYNSIANISSYEQGDISDHNSTKSQLYFIEKNMDIINGRYVAKDGYGNDINSNMPYFSGFIDVEQSGIFDYSKKYGKDANATANNQSAQYIRLMDFGVDDLQPLFGNVVKANYCISPQDYETKYALYFPFINVGRDISVEEKYYQFTNSKAIFPISLYADNQLCGNAAGTKTGSRGFAVVNTPPQIGDIATIVNSRPSFISKDTDGNLYITQRNADTNMQNQRTLIAKNISRLYLWTESSSSLIRIRLCLKSNLLKDIMQGKDENGNTIGEFCKEGIIMQ